MKILHITDLHTGWREEREQEQSTWERLYEEVNDAAKRGQRPDAVAVTGDLVMHGTREEYERTERYLNKLIKVLGVEKSQVFFCCGNHDSDTPEAGSPFKEYEKFVERFYGGEKPTSRLPIFSISSCKKTSLTDFNNCWMDPKDVDRILEKGGDGKKGILLMHHQPEMFDDQSQMERLKDRIGLILGGHLHTGYTRQYDWKGMTVVNGMAITPHLDFLPRGFQIIDVGDEGSAKTVMYVFKDGKGVWEERA